MRKLLQPTSEELECGAHYGFAIEMRGDHSSGVIWRVPGEPRWRYSASSTRPAFARTNPFRKRDVVFTDSTDAQILLIRRTRFSPPTFEMVENGTRVGQITSRSVFRNRYQIDIVPDQSWDFRMPLFTSHFHGVSDAGTRIFAQVRTNLTQWAVLVAPGAGHTWLVFALALIHNRAWNNG